jgi:hypothetical protein
MKLYFGRVAPTEPQKEQLNGEGWAWRYQVRILDKHTADKTVLPDKKLPWAQVLLPVTAGSGAGNYATSPAINQGDTVSIAYLDDAETQPIITGILPRTEEVSTDKPDSSDGYIPTTGFTENREKKSKMPPDESNQSNKTSQQSTRSDRFSPSIGDTTILADSCDPNKYRSNTIITEINNLFNAIQKFSDDAAYIESLIAGTVDRIHAVVNSYVGEVFNKIFEALIKPLNRGLSALYKAVYAAVLASTGGNAVAARLAAEAALLAFRPAVLALQLAISEVANQIVSGLLGKVDSLVRDAVNESDNFTQCAGTQFAGALVNSIIGEVDSAISPLLKAVAKILSGGFDIASKARSTANIVRDFGGGLLAGGQGGNKCGGLIREYAYGIGPRADIGDILDGVLEAANEASAIVDEAIATGEAVSDFAKSFGDFPFLSTDTEIGKTLNSSLNDCSREPPPVCLPPEVVIFGGRGEGATAIANVGRYIRSEDERTISDIQGGVVSIEVINGGSGYKYPPFVDIRDNCNLGIGAVARSVIEDGVVTRIYLVDPGEMYPAASREVFVIGDVVIIEGGFNYQPGRVTDNFGNSYEVIVDDGTIIGIIPETLIPVTQEPIIDIPVLSPDNPDGTPAPGGVVYKPTLVRLPKAIDIIEGRVPDSIADRINQQTRLLQKEEPNTEFIQTGTTKISNVIDCVED